MFTKDNLPKDDDFTPDAVKFREENPNLFSPDEEARNKEHEEAEDEQPVGADGHKPHAVFSESETPRSPEKQDNTPAPTHFEHLSK